MPFSCALLGGFAIGTGCYGNITRTRNVSEYMLVLALWIDLVAVAPKLVCFSLVHFW